jgi:SEC-C motif-containing protein
MRSRFSAFCIGHVDYLISTHHPSQRRDDDRAQLAASLNHCQWLELSIIHCQQGSTDQQHGEVEFIASYRQDGQLAQLHERSRFVKEQGRWFYLHGDILETAQSTSKPSKPGRNQPCHCGSGKKFKHCHGG